jgi:drug/metabolite transporter (DMT)-like permease
VSLRKPIDAQAMGLMLLLSIIWGLQQVALKGTASDMAPVLLIAVRSGVAAVLVGALMAMRQERPLLQPGNWRPGLVVGALFALEYLLVAEGLRLSGAAHIVVFLYTAPIFAALGLHRNLPAERLVALQWVGIGVAFAGIALAFFGRAQTVTITDTRQILWGDFLGLLAGAAWGATTVVVRTTRLSSAPASETLLYQLVAACVLLLLAAFASGQTAFTPTPMLLANLVFQVVIVSFTSFLVWFWMLRHYLASQLGVFSFMTPLFGVAFGVWLLHEPLELAFLAGSALVLAGILLVNGHAWLRARFQ